VGVLSRPDADDLDDLSEPNQRRDSLARHLVYNIN
jgi:hypothetical protein